MPAAQVTSGTQGRGLALQMRGSPWGSPSWDPRAPDSGAPFWSARLPALLSLLAVRGRAACLSIRVATPQVSAAADARANRGVLRPPRGAGFTGPRGARPSPGPDNPQVAGGRGGESLL